ncbi:MAG TPA: YafY family protein [Ilumatobacter sp.]|nr:YafY family protein [Ilumatobacter sp.]
MADSTARALALLSLLQTHRHWAGAELADRLGVSERTVRRDVDRLRQLGYPVDAVPGVDGGYQLAAGAHLPPLLFDDDEAVALAVGLRTAAGSAIDGVEETAVRVMAKLERMLPDRVRRRVEAVHANVSVARWSPSVEPVAASTMVAVAQACRDREEVRFEYHSREGNETSRLVQPHQLVAFGRRWYLVAWDVRRDDWRTFRLDRMGAPSLAGARFPERPIPGGDAAAYLASTLRLVPRDHRAVLTLSAPPDEVDRAARGFDGVVEHLGDDHSRMVVQADTVAWLAALIAMLASSVPLRIDEAPDEVVQLVKTTAQRLTGSLRQR